MSTCWSRKRPSHLLSCTDIIINVGSRCENISTTNWISLNSSSPAEDPIPNHLNKPIPLFWPVTWSFPTISRYDLSMKLVWNVENRHLFTSFRLFRTFFFSFFFFTPWFQVEGLVWFLRDGPMSLLTLSVEYLNMKNVPSSLCPVRKLLLKPVKLMELLRSTFFPVQSRWRRSCICSSKLRQYFSSFRL